MSKERTTFENDLLEYLNHREDIATADEELRRIDNTLSKFNYADIQNINVEAFHQAYATDYTDDRLFGADMNFAIQQYVAGKENEFDPANINIQHMRAYCESLSQMDFLQEPSTDYITAKYAYEMATVVEPNGELTKQLGEFKDVLEEKFPTMVAETSNETGCKLAIEFLEQNNLSISDEIKARVLTQAIENDQDKQIAYERDIGPI